MMLLILIGIIDMRKFLGLLIFISSAAYTQELDSLETDTVEILPKHLVGGFVELGISQRPGPAGNASMRNVGLGLRYDRYELEYHVNVFSGDYVERLIFPNSFALLYAHGGFKLSYYLYESDYFNMAPFISYQLGDMVWERSDTKEDFLRDTFSISMVGLKIESPCLRYLRPEVEIGYQRASNFDLPSLNAETFTGFFLGFNVKLGYFNQ